MNPLTQSRKTTIRPLLIALGLAYFALSPAAQAVTPAPDGGYPNYNTAEGDFALQNLTTGAGNTAVGWEALEANTTGSFNTATGYYALLGNFTGFHNTATGVTALANNRGSFNTATGSAALNNNIIGISNTATGSFALRDAACNYNTATGSQALFLSFGDYNTATGYQALWNNTSGGYNTASGFASLLANTDGYFDTADGVFALFTNTTGYQNFGGGVSALYNNTIGHDNTACGYQALGGNQSGNNNIGIGSNNIDIGAFGVAGESNTIRIGKFGLQQSAYMQGIRGSPITGTSVVVNSAGRLGTVTSSQRFKDDIKPMDKASEAILALKPVTFRYKKEIDPAGTSQFGLVAEEVEKVNPDLVVRDQEGKTYSVRYDQVNAMLLNEFLKEHRRVTEQDGKLQQQEETIAQLKKDFQATVAELNARLREQDSKIEKVSAQLEVNKTAPQIVLNNQ